MPSPPWAFLLDENLPKRAATALRRAGYSAARVVEVGLRAQKDPVIFAYARRQGLIIVTRDADFLASQYQPPHAGIILLALPGVPGRTVVDPLMAALTSLQGQDLTNKVYLVDPSGLHVIWAWPKAKLADVTIWISAHSDTLDKELQAIRHTVAGLEPNSVHHQSDG